MPFVIAASAGSSGFAASPLNVASVPCGTAANTVIIGWMFGASSLTNSITGMTVGGSSSGVVAQAQTAVAGTNNHRLFTWTGTGPGTVDVQFQWTGDISFSQAVVLVYSGYSGIANYTVTPTAGSTSAPSVTVTSATGDLAIGFWCHVQPTVSATASGTLRFDAADGTARAFVFEEPGAASVAVDGTTSASVTQYVTAGFSLVAAAAAAAITSPSGAVMTGAAGQVNAFSAAAWRSL